MFLNIFDTENHGAKTLEKSPVGAHALTGVRGLGFEDQRFRWCTVVQAR